MLCCASSPGHIERQERPAIAALPGPAAELEEWFGNDLLRPKDPEYANSRYVGKEETVSWTVSSVGYPAAICQCTSVAQVQKVVNYARKYCQPAGVPLALAGGRHSHLYMPDNALVCDLSGMKAVKVMPEKQLASVSAGCRIKDLQAACMPHNLAPNAGSHGSVGVMGFYLHGGHGPLDSKMGMAVDNIVEAKIVTADGQLLTCNNDEHPELFWAMCGCGSAFGVVVEITVRLFLLSKGGMVPAATTVHVPLGSLGLPGRAHLIGRFRDFFKRPENADTAGCLILPGGGPVIEQCIWIGGSLEDSQKIWTEHNKSTGWLTPLRDLKEKQYHTELDAPDDGPEVGFNLTVELSDLTDAGVEILNTCVDSTVSPHSKGSAIVLSSASRISAKLPKDTNAFFHRDTKFHIVIAGAVPKTFVGDAYVQKMSEVKRWAHEVRQKLEAITPSIVLGGYNVMHDTPAAKVYGDNLPRLQQLKQEYDTQNLFALGMNLSG